MTGAPRPRVRRPACGLRARRMGSATGRGVRPRHAATVYTAITIATARTPLGM